MALVDVDVLGLAIEAQHVEQRRDVDSGITQSSGDFGIRDLFNSNLDLADPRGSLGPISRVAHEHIHQVIDPPRSRFQPVTIQAVIFEVHERIARVRKARAQCPQTRQDVRLI
jgi:hypothetical protein